RAQRRQQADHRRRGHERFVPPAPPRRPLRQRRPACPDRLILEKTPQVVGQLLGGGVARFRTFLYRAFRTMVSNSGGIARFKFRGARGSSKATCRSSSSRSQPEKAASRVNSSYKVTPSE